jgi:hypothetical protein
MVDALVAFLRDRFTARDVAPPPGKLEDPRSRTLTIDGHVLHVWHRGDDRMTSLYAESGLGAPPLAAYATVETIGTRFNEALARGEHQALFTELPQGR